MKEALAMRALHLLALAGALGTVVAPTALIFAPIAALAASPPTKQQIETAVRSANPTIGQMRKLKKLEPKIDGMTSDELEQALGKIFSGSQLIAIQQSLKAQGAALPG